MVIKSLILMMTLVIITGFSWATQIIVSTNYDAYLIVKASLPGFRLVTEQITSGTNQLFDIKEDLLSENSEIALYFDGGLLHDKTQIVPLSHEHITALLNINTMYVEILEETDGEIPIKIKLDDVATIHKSIAIAELLEQEKNEQLRLKEKRSNLESELQAVDWVMWFCQNSVQL